MEELRRYINKLPISDEEKEGFIEMINKHAEDAYDAGYEEAEVIYNPECL